MERSNDAEAVGSPVSNVSSKSVAIERADCHGSTITNDVKISRQWRPAASFVRLICWTQVELGSDVRTEVGKCVGCNRGIANGAAEAIIFLRLKDRPSLFQDWS